MAIRQLSGEYFQNVQKAFPYGEYAFICVPVEQAFGLGIAVRNEAGYTPVPEFHYLADTYKAADDEAERINSEVLALSGEDAAKIIISSMAAQNGQAPAEPDEPSYFQYYEIALCAEWEDDGDTPGHCEVINSQEELDEHMNGPTPPDSIFWTIYGVWDTGESEAIGDFTTRKAAEEILHGMMHIPAMALRDWGTPNADGPGGARGDLEDLIYQTAHEYEGEPDTPEPDPRHYHSER